MHKYFYHDFLYQAPLFDVKYVSYINKKSNKYQYVIL